MEVNVKDVLPPKHKLREDVGDLAELKESLKESGQIQPIIVRELANTPSKYEIVDGHRRWLALQEIGYELIKIENKGALTDKDTLEVGLLSNIQRKSMDVIEEANAFKIYVIDNGYGSARDLSKKLGMSDSYVSRRLDLLDLPIDTFARVKTGEITPSHGEELSRLDTAQAEELADIVTKTDLTRDQTAKAVSFIKAGLAPVQAVHTVINNPDMKPPKESDKFDSLQSAREQVPLALAKSLKVVDFNLDILGDGPEQGKWIADVRYPLHELVNVAQKLQRDYGGKKE